jgi:hypothetical protein
MDIRYPYCWTRALLHGNSNSKYEGIRRTRGCGRPPGAAPYHVFRKNYLGGAEFPGLVNGLHEPDFLRVQQKSGRLPERVFVAFGTGHLNNRLLSLTSLWSDRGSTTGRVEDLKPPSVFLCGSPPSLSPSGERVWRA